MGNKKYKQIEIVPLPHGGKRENAGRKKVDESLKKPKTVAIRIDVKLLPEIQKLKNGESIKNELNQNQINKILEKIDEIRKLREDAELLEYKRKGEDCGQFGKIIDMDGSLIRLKEMIEKL